MSDDEKIYESDLFQAAPDAPTRELREAASILHARIVLSATESFKQLAKTRNAEDTRNCIASAMISALAEIVLGFKIDHDYVKTLLDTQIEKILKEKGSAILPFGRGM